jgi:SSS family solute:Na+ symporter
VNGTALAVFVVLFALVTVVGFWAASWRRGDLTLLVEWALAGRRFGTFITWFLIGGDLYTAYTFIAVPALVFGAGALGFFAVPYTILVFPIMFVVLPRFWAVARAHGYVTPADFVRGRFDSRGLALAVAVTGILATMPYIALQLVGIQVVLQAMGVVGSTGLLRDLPLIIAFGLLAAYTYTSGLRAPATTAVIKDALIYITVIVACIAIPLKLGGYGHIFQAANLALTHAAKPSSIFLSSKSYLAFATLAVGSAFALLLYPHAVTGMLAANGQNTIKRNAALLPLYSIALALIALFGYMALAAGIHTKVTSLVVPLLFLKMFPAWFVGFAFAAVAIGALVPAAIMSIAASNLFTRNIYREYFAPAASTQTEARVAKLVSLVVKLGAVVFVVALPLQFAINLQLLGGIWILQTLPSVMLGLYTRWLHRTALLIGWLVGMGLGTWMAVAESFKSSVYPLVIGHLALPGYAAVYAVLANLVVTVVLTLLFNALKVSNGVDQTATEDYQDDEAPAAGAL